MNTIARVFALLVVLTLAAQGEPLSSPPNRIVLPADVVPERYDIRVIPDAEALTFTGQVNIAISVIVVRRGETAKGEFALDAAGCHRF